MGVYTKSGPFVNGSAPGISAAFLNAQEDAIVNGGFIYFLGSPYHLTTNPTVNANNTTNLTCTGGGTGVPTGAKGVLLQIGLFSVTAQGGSVQIYPTGGTAGVHCNITAQGPTNSYCQAFGIAPLSAGGQITVKAITANMVLQDWYIFGYIM